jgi:hypothetical protein
MNRAQYKRWEQAGLAGERAGTRARRAGGTWEDILVHGGVLARAYARRLGHRSQREYARLVLNYGKAYLDLAGAALKPSESPGQW